MRHPLYLMSNKRRSADRRAKYGILGIYGSLSSRAATTTVQRPMLLVAPWPSGILQSLTLGPELLVRVLELVLCQLLRIGMEIASACREGRDDQSTPLCLSCLLSAARLRGGPQDSLGLLAMTWGSGSRCARHRCRSSRRSRRGRSGLGDRPGWVEPRGRRPTLAILACGSTRPSSALNRPGRSRGRGAVCRRERASGFWSSRSVSGKRCVRDPCVTALRDAFRT